MTALGNVLALIRQLDEAAGAPLDGSGSASMQFRDFPAPNELASSLGDVLAFRRAAETDGDPCWPDEASAVSRQRESRPELEAFRRIRAAFNCNAAEVRV
ncbi:MAG: hypothetical protein ROZ37_03515 [Aromatoleum sp.]|jgi:predicted secreted protein|uniref:hypothetical protein n=1 Tax=Aromatoleum sp. TaxID=2307007 RepID=UPI002895FEB4|nr:hypothetical protein [Aromatoleum sp.]MDT3669387.1 hypothetical protein [Aromatoleum sp.]